MNFLADESVDAPIVQRLRAEGHVVQYVAETARSISDDEVATWANTQALLLLTADKDFGELMFRQHRLTTGVVLLRLYGLSPQTKAEIVARAVAQYAAEMSGAFTVITPGALRHRRP